MPEQTTFRLVRPTDSPALEALIAATADSGRIGFTDEYRADLFAVHRALATDLQGAVALRDDRLVGTAFGDVHPIQVSGGVKTGAYLSHLSVHPEYRRQGIAGGLADWGLAHLSSLYGPELVLYAAIMQGNLSLKLAERFGFQSTQPIRGGVVPLRRRPPGLPADLEVRLARAADLPAMARGMNRFYREHNFWSPVSPASLQDFLEREVAGVRPNQLYLAARGGEIAAGLSLSDRTGLVRMRITRASWLLRILGAWLGVLPRSGVLRVLTARRLWFREGDLEAGRALWETLRFELCDRADALGIAYDPRDPVAQVYRVPFWLPMFPARYLVRAPQPLETGRPTYCIAGP